MDKISKKRNIGLFIFVISMSPSYSIVFSGLVTSVRTYSMLYWFTALSILILPIFPAWILLFGEPILSEQSLKVIESIITIGSSTTIGMHMLSRTIHGTCGDVAFYDTWHCNPHYNSNSLPRDTGIHLYYCFRLCSLYL